jgi:hypothetical protein
VKELVDKAAQVAPLLKITRDDINNKVRNIKGPREQWEVSPAIPYHAIGYPTLSTNLDLSISSSLISERMQPPSMMLSSMSWPIPTILHHRRHDHIPEMAHHISSQMV